jgi:hypothetical protein
MVGVFSTTHSVGFGSTIWNPSYTLTTTFAPFDDPTTTNAPTCNNNHKNDPDLKLFFAAYNGPPYKTAQATTCETRMRDIVTSYVDYYKSTVYSWRQCFYYQRDFHNILCTVNKLIFGTYCDTDVSGSDDFHMQHFMGGTPSLIS